MFCKEVLVCEDNALWTQPKSVDKVRLDDGTFCEREKTLKKTVFIGLFTTMNFFYKVM